MGEDFSFLNEKIKEKPFYKKKPVRMIAATAGLAVLFGLISCAVFVKAYPWLEKRLGGAQNIEIPEDFAEDPQQPPENALGQEEEQPPIVVDSGITLEEYGILCAEFQGLAREAQRALVTVTAVRSDVDWFNVAYENSGQTSGMIIGDNGIELLILTKYGEIKESDGINVTFADGTVSSAAMKKFDRATGLAVISVNLGSLPAETKEKITQAKLGNSVRLEAGTPVLALGYADGSQGSMKVGMLTSVHSCQSVVDAEYTVFATDMARNPGADGVLVNLNGEIIGIIEDEHLPGNTEDVLMAYAISDIKKLIERLSNGQDVTYLGIKGVTVTEAALAQGVPEGVYVTEAEMESPAMLGGIQSGDVIQKINGQKIGGMEELSEALQKLSDRQEISLEGQRQTGNGYKKINYKIVLSILE